MIDLRQGWPPSIMADRLVPPLPGSPPTTCAIYIRYVIYAIYMVPPIISFTKSCPILCGTDERGLSSTWLGLPGHTVSQRSSRQSWRSSTCCVSMWRGRHWRPAPPCFSCKTQKFSLLCCKFDFAPQLGKPSLVLIGWEKQLSLWSILKLKGNILHYGFFALSKAWSLWNFVS